jgi:hypothetical protein
MLIDINAAAMLVTDVSHAGQNFGERKLLAPLSSLFPFMLGLITLPSEF